VLTPTRTLAWQARTFAERARTLAWQELPADVRAALEGRLEGLYNATSDVGEAGEAGDASVFDALPVDKQQALLIFVRRLSRLRLWRAVVRVTNVYGEGGVGLEFIAAPGLKSRLRRDRRFTARFAAHRDTAEGFYEFRRPTAALHFLRARRGGREWAVHFDLYAPLASPLSALRHLWHEKLRAETPRWEEIAASLGYDPEQHVT
jgi:hypothetical protein